MSLVERRARRVLVADDEPLVLELIVTRLSIAGFEVRAAKDGAQALDRLTDFRPEALVLDINMPKLDGFGVLSHMRVQGLSDKVPTLVLTARNAAEDVAKAIKLGAKDYLSKPFRDEQLIQRVGRLFNRARPVGR
ncbi:MAG: response regulator [Pseudomonadota bacterium]